MQSKINTNTNNNVSSYSRSLINLGQYFFRHRNWFFPLVLMGLMALFPPAPRLSWVIGGWLLAIAGQLIRGLTVGYAYIRRGGKDGHVYADSLRTEGFFSLCRNPLYLGNLLILSGLVLIYGSLGVLLIGIPLALVMYHLIVMAEEQFLFEKFENEFAEYSRRVNRWIPNPMRCKDAFRGLQFSWKRLVIKEYSSFTMWVGIGLLLMIWQHGGVRSGLFIGLLVLDLVVMLVARYLKKNDIITGPGPVIHKEK